VVVCDTDPLVALSNVKDAHYVVDNDLFRDLHMAAEQIVLPAMVLAEVCYWLDEHGGPEVEAAFLDAVAHGTFTLIELTNEDVERMAELVRTFSSFQLGGTRRVGCRRGGAARRAGDRNLRPPALPGHHAKTGGHFTLLPEQLRGRA
jgi:predicted nucleic acid-binding protein